MLRRDDESLPPRARALSRLAATLTEQPWTLTPDVVRDASAQGLDEGQVEAAVGVISMFNYFTRVADATGIEFDYETPLPAFEPDVARASAPRPGRPASQPSVARRQPGHPPLRAAWQSWRAYELETEGPIGTRERRLLARVAAEEAGDWAGAEALGSGAADDDLLAGFARKLSREPWRMQEADLQSLRAAGYPELAVLHVISVVAHQNADSRLAIGLAAAALS